jgi:hypothetical protein
MTHWRDEIAAWWDDVRDWMAFGIAPLAVPLLVGMSVGFDAMIAIFSLMFSYFVTLLFGLPLYAFLRAYGYTNFWLAPGAGLVAGIATTHLAHLWLGLPAMPIAGVAGAAVGALLWLIARPDRPRRSAQAGLLH